MATTRLGLSTTLLFTVAYDANGNTLSDPSGKSYSWDFENRLTQVVNPGVGTTTFRYDPFGRRIQKSGPLGTTNYLYDGTNLIEEVDSGGNALARYTHGVAVDEPLSMLHGGATSYYQADGLGSVTSLSNGSSELAETYSVDSFGKTTSSGSLVNSFQYTGRESDSEIGLYYYRARYYSPQAGRFISEDPLGSNAGGNLYRYAHNNPIKLADPFGLTDILITVSRGVYTGNSTTGTINVDAGDLGSVTTASLERPLSSDSPVAIPAGDYTAHYRTDSGPGLNHHAVELDPRNGRTHIQIHPGNTSENTEGCILPGRTRGRNSVGASRAATADVNGLVESVIQHDRETGQTTNIFVRVINAQSSEQIMNQP